MIRSVSAFVWWVKTIRTRRLARQLWGAAAPSSFDEIAAMCLHWHLTSKGPRP